MAKHGKRDRSGRPRAESTGQPSAATQPAGMATGLKYLSLLLLATTGMLLSSELMVLQRGGR